MATKIINTTQKVDSKRFSDNYENIFGKHKLNITPADKGKYNYVQNESKNSDKLQR